MRHLIAGAFVALAASVALADTLTLNDGSKLEGRFVEQRADEIVFDQAVGARTLRLTLRQSDVKSIELKKLEPRKETAALPTLPTPTSPADYPELKGYDKHVILVLDRSGSMSIAGRFGAAYDQVATIISGLHPSAKLGVLLFDSKPVNVFGDYFALAPNDILRGQLRSRVRELGINMDGATDLVAGLAPAIQHRPDAIYLLSDGVATHGPEDADAIVKAIKALLPRKGKKLPIHVVGVFGGKHEDGLVEDTDTAREILKAIAQATSGTYREVTAHWKRPGSAVKPARNFDEEVELHTWDTGLPVYWYAGKRKTPDGDVTNYVRHPGEHNEFKQKCLVFKPTTPYPYVAFTLEVRDHFLASGSAVIEYSDQRLDLRTRTQKGVVFDERKNVPLTYKAFPDAGKKFVKIAGDLFTSEWDEVTYEGSLWTETRPILVMLGNDEPKPSDAESFTIIKIPTWEKGVEPNPTLELAYSRGGHKWTHTLEFADARR